MSELAFSWRGLTIERNGVRLVDEVDLDLKARETTALVGESGAGKSLALRASLGILDASFLVSGQLSLHGENVGNFSKIRGTQVALVFQEPGQSLNPVRKIGSQLQELYEGSRAERLASAQKQLTRLELPERVMTQYPLQLSGGMQQRVALAMALARNPTVLLTDEPTTALDASLAAELLDMLQARVDEDNLTWLLVSHDLAAVVHRSQTSVVMYAGQVVEAGPSESLWSTPKHPYTSLLWTTRLQWDEAPPRLQALAPVASMPLPGRWPTGCRFADRCDRVDALCREKMPELVTLGERKLRCHHPLDA